MRGAHLDYVGRRWHGLPVSGDEWLFKDLAVLEAVRDLEEEAPVGQQFTASDVASRLALDLDACMKLLLRLARADYIDADPVTTASGVHEVYVVGLAERGRRAVGQWPSSDPWTNLVELLGQQIEAEPDEDKRSKLLKFRDGVLTSGRGVGLSLLTKYLEQQAGLG